MPEHSPASEQDPAVPAERPSPAAGSYRLMLGSSALFGASALAGLAIGMVRTKLMALLLGPAGYGLFGAYLLIADLARSAGQMGLNASGVRQIAAAAARADGDAVGRTALVLRRVGLGCALLGAGGLAGLAVPVAQLSFGDTAHAPGVLVLSAAVFFGVLSGAQLALLQGLRRVAELARFAVLASLLGTLSSVPAVYLLGEAGVPLAIVLAAASALAVSWWASRRHRPAAPRVDAVAQLREAGTLLRLGVAVMASGLLMTGAAYAVRTLVLRQLGADAAGLYFAAWTLGGLYIGFVLQALGTDFYPRLVALAHDDPASNQLVNQQARVSLLLALPGVLATLALAPWALAAFYSARFGAAEPVLRWICLGMALRVLTWPVGTVMLARNRQMLLVATEFAWAALNVGLTAWWLPRHGAAGAGMAFFAAYLAHAAMVVPAARHLSGFRFEADCRRIALGSVAAVALVFVATAWLPPLAGLAVGAAAAAASALVSLRGLMRLVEPGQPRGPVARLLGLAQRLRLVPPAAARPAAAAGERP